MSRPIVLITGASRGLGYHAAIHLSTAGYDIIGTYHSRKEEAQALAAVLSPTDAVALSGIVGEGCIPKKLMDILQGEALMNE